MIKRLLLSIAIVAPFSVFAFERSLRGLAGYITELIGSSVVPLLVSVALTWFIWGLVDFIRSAENSDARKKGKSRMVWGIIALFFMVSFISISSIFTNTFFNRGASLPQLYENQ